jgi:predicted RNase H-like HicB family nuclease
MPIVYTSLKICLFSEEHGLLEQEWEEMVRPIKVIVEKHADGYVAYPLGVQGVVVGEGDSYEEALSDVKSALRFHLETFGPGIFETESQVLEACVKEKYDDISKGER